MFHWLQRVRHFKPVLVAQRWLNLFQGYPIPQGFSTQSRPEGRGLNPTFLVREVLEVFGNDHGCLAMNGRSQYVAVIGVGELELRNEMGLM